MPTFHYTALTHAGTETHGEETAPTMEALRQSLQGRGLLVQNVRPKQEPFFRRTSIRSGDFLLFNQEFIALLRAGLTLPASLSLVARRPDNPRLGAVLQQVMEAVRGGAALSQACAAHPQVFDGLYLAALRTGEKTGGLVESLTRYQAFLRKRVALQKRLSQALTYPLFLLVALGVILGVLFVFVLPRFVAMYADFGAALPWSTRVLIGFVERLPVLLPILLIIGGLLAYGWRRWVATEEGRLAVDRAKQRLPYWGRLETHALQAHLAQSLSTLLAGGTALMDALQTAAAALPNRAYGARLLSASQQVAEGKSLASALAAENLLSDTAIKMVEVGESSGGLDGMLAEVAQYYEDILESHLGRVMSLIEPLLMLLMGILVGGIIIVMYLPIFHMAEIIK